MNLIGKKMIDIGDFVLIEGVPVHDDEGDPNGFPGIVCSATIPADNANSEDNGEVYYDIQLPVCWDEGKHTWTFRECELILLEENIANK